MAGLQPTQSPFIQQALGATEVATYRTYHDAQAAIERLTAAGFPAADLGIIGQSPRLVERVMGRVGWGRIFLEGFFSGAWLGLMAAILMAVLGTPTDQIYLLLPLLLLGSAVMLGVMRLVTFKFLRKGPKVATVQSLVAASYTLVAISEADRARHILGLGRPQTPLQYPDGPTPFGSKPNEQPRYGVRIRPEGSDAAR